MMFHVSNRIKGRAVERIGAGMGWRELENELDCDAHAKGSGHSVFVFACFADTNNSAWKGMCTKAEHVALKDHIGL